MAALFGGNDDQVLVGRMTEEQWWEVIRSRLVIQPAVIDELRRDLAGREVWDHDLVAAMRDIRQHARTAIVSNAWPELRNRMACDGLLDIVDELVLSCEVGYAKPDRRIFMIAMQRIAIGAEDVLFIDDTAAHVSAARSLGMHGHVHVTAHSTITAIEGFVEDDL